MPWLMKGFLGCFGSVSCSCLLVVVIFPVSFVFIWSMRRLSLLGSFTSMFIGVGIVDGCPMVGEKASFSVAMVS